MGLRLIKKDWKFRMPTTRQTIECDICFRIFRTDMIYIVALHRKKEHGMETVINGTFVDAKVPEELCHLCGASVKKGYMINHIGTHHNPKERRYPCDSCDKTFNNSNLLLWHRRSYHMPEHKVIHFTAIIFVATKVTESFQIPSSGHL